MINLTFEQRWPGVRQTGLGGGPRVGEEAARGGTSVMGIRVLLDRDGHAMLGYLLESHAPVG